MLIRKEYRVESAHIVRNCSSERCAHSIHGHSAIIEVMLRCPKLDKAGMVYDFGLMKSTIKQFIDSMDHCTLFWDKDESSYIDAIKANSERWISLPFNPSAENLSIFIAQGVKHILDHTNFKNDEGNIQVYGVRYHETATGYAQCEPSDIAGEDLLAGAVFSEKVMDDWSADLRLAMNGLKVDNPQPFNQVY